MCADPPSPGAATSTQGLAQADVTVEGEYSTQVQTHCCMEPHAIVADWRPDGLTVYMSTQFTTGVRHELAEEFGLPLNKVRVIVDAMGGGFGSKSSLGNYGRIAVELSRRAKAPVGSSSIAKKSRWMPATVRAPGSVCASAPSAMAR